MMLHILSKTHTLNICILQNALPWLGIALACLCKRFQLGTCINWTFLLYQIVDWHWLIFTNLLLQQSQFPNQNLFQELRYYKAKKSFLWLIVQLKNKNKHKDSICHDFSNTIKKISCWLRVSHVFLGVLVKKLQCG